MYHCRFRGLACPLICTVLYNLTLPPSPLTCNLLYKSLGIVDLHAGSIDVFSAGTYIHQYPSTSVNIRLYLYASLCLLTFPYVPLIFVDHCVSIRIIDPYPECLLPLECSPHSPLLVSFHLIQQFHGLFSLFLSRCIHLFIFIHVSGTVIRRRRPGNNVFHFIAHETLARRNLAQSGE